MLRACGLLILLLCAAAPAARAAEVSAGALRAATSSDPWALTFSERSGREVLGQAGTLAPTGALGFRTAAGWFSATRVVSESSPGHAVVATLATDDPLGRRLTVRIAPDAEGVIAVRATVQGADVTHVGMGFRTRAGERYLGFGERSNAIDQRGNEVESYVAEGPFEEDERPVVPAFVPPWGFHPRDDATYFPMPWLLSSTGYGVLVDSPQTSLFRLGTRSPGVWSVEVEARELRLRVFAGPRPADVLRRLTARIGRQPRPAPHVFGPWYQPRDAEEAILDRLQRADVPLSVAQTYTHYLPCEDQRGREAAERARVARFHREGLAVTTYFNPMICTTHSRYGEAAAGGALLRNGLGAPYVYRYSTLEDFEVSQFDFSAAAGRELYGRLLGEALADGHDGWMEDFGEYTPLDGVAADGSTGSGLHNDYPRRYHCAAAAAAPRAARFVRSGWTGSAACAPVVWGGDPSVDWGFDGLRSALVNGLTMGLSGVSTWGSDIGGFFALFENRLTPELLVRWIELGAVSGVMRTQANGIRIPDSPRPQIWDREIVGHWRRWAKLRTQLYPYLAAADRVYRRSGLPIMRHLALAFPGDRRAGAREDQFMFGPDLLAAPVLAEGERRRRLYLPRGRWVDLWRSVRYRRARGDLALRRSSLLAGGREVTLPAALGKPPLLARAGTLLALLPPDVDTLARYGRRAAAVGLAERSGRRALLAWPRGRSSATAGGRRRAALARGPARLEPHAALATAHALDASGLTRHAAPAVVALPGERERRADPAPALRPRRPRPADDAAGTPRDAERPALLKPQDCVQPRGRAAGSSEKPCHATPPRARLRDRSSRPAHHCRRADDTEPSSGGTGSCADSADAAAATPASATGDSPSGGTPDSGPDIAPASSGGTGTSISLRLQRRRGRRDRERRRSGSGAPPLAGAAQEPEPEPEGPGQEQPEEPGGEPQDPTGEEPVEGGEGGETGGGLPRTGLAVLQLLLLGVVLVLVGARLRVLLKRRRDAREEPEPDAPADLEPDGLPREDAVVAYRQPADDLEVEEDEEYEYDEPGYAEEDMPHGRARARRRRRRVDLPRPRRARADRPAAQHGDRPPAGAPAPRALRTGRRLSQENRGARQSPHPAPGQPGRAEAADRGRAARRAVPDLPRRRGRAADRAGG